MEVCAHLREGYFQGLLDDGGDLKKDHPVTASELRSRGWTDSLIKKFLTPVALVENPHYKYAGKMRIYRYSDVSIVESTEEFYMALDKSRRYSIAAKIVAQAKQQHAQEFARSIDISFPDMDRIKKDALIEIEKDGQMHFAETIQSMLEKLMLVMTLKELKPVYWRLDDLYGRKGAVIARDVLDKRVVGLMEIRCPELIPYLQGVGVSQIVTHEME